MATKAGVLKELEIEKKCYGSPNKLVEDDSASRPARKIFLAKEKGSASRVGKVLDFGGMEASGGSKPAGVVKVASTNKKAAASSNKKKAASSSNKKKAASSNKKATEPVEEDSASRFAGKLVPCKVCVAKGEDAGCDICVAKAAALDRIKAAGGDIDEIVAKEGRKIKTAGIVNAAELNSMEAAGGRVIKPPAKVEGMDKPLVTVRLPGASVERFMSVPRAALRPLAEDFYQRNPELREPFLVGATMALWNIERAEDIHEQFFNKGYVTVQLEFEECY